MNTLVAEYWIWLVVALIIGLIVAWYVFHASRKTNVTGTSRDVLDDGADHGELDTSIGRIGGGKAFHRIVRTHPTSAEAIARDAAPDQFLAHRPRTL